MSEPGDRLSIPAQFPIGQVPDVQVRDKVGCRGETKASYIVYAVDRHVIVTPDKVEVIAPVPQRPGARPTQAWLTMTACHPKFSAQYRYIVFARLVKNISRASGLPSSFVVVPAGAVG